MVHSGMELSAFVSQTTPLKLVILGGAGNLALQRIIPAIYKLWSIHRLPNNLEIIAIDLGQQGTEQYRGLACQIIQAIHGTGQEAGQPIGDFIRHVHFLGGDITKPETYRSLAAAHFRQDDANALFYLACTPALFGTAARLLAESKLAGNQHAANVFRRLVIEKPFGTDLAAARDLNCLLHRYYPETDLFRIDHYLGKDAVQNLIYFRFTNTIFEPLWNRKYIDRVEIVLSEDGGIGNRGGYYDQAGATRDMLQNHLMQLFCLTAMETPTSLSDQAVREEKVRLLRATLLPEHSAELPAYVRGQYRAAKDCGQGSGLDSRAAQNGDRDSTKVKLPAFSTIPDYRKEAFVPPESSTETFVALKLYVDNWRWQGVPFILKTGKALQRRYGEIGIHFRQCPVDMPGVTPDANRLILRIQPEEGVSMRFNTRAPGGLDSEHEELVGTLRDSASASPGPYERLLLDALRGDSTLFIRFDETEEAWQLVDPVLKRWAEQGSDDLLPYPAGSNGPDISRLYRHHPLWKQTYSGIA